MARLSSLFASVFVVVTLAAACTSDPVASDPTTPEPATATPTAEAETVEPAATAAPTVVTDAGRVEAVVAQLDSEIAAGNGPSDTIAYDLLGSKVAENGDVTLTICAWTGETVFDSVRDSLYRTVVAEDGTITATHVTTPVAAGECVNSQLIESAFDHINAFGEYWASIVTNPADFATDGRSSDLLTPRYDEISADLVQTWLDDDVYVEPSFIPGDIREERSAIFCIGDMQPRGRTFWNLLFART